MTFTTLTFILFLAVVFSLYWTMRHRVAQNWLLVVASYFFYGWWDYRFCGLMLASSLVDYGIGLGLDRSRNQTARRALLGLSIAVGLGMLGFFKYFNFFAENLQRMAGSIGWQMDEVTLRVVLPVGISFYTFQTMSYAFDVYREKLRATTHLGEYLAYVSFFPQLVAGPIERATHFLPQFFQTREFDGSKAADGCRQMIWGFFKKMVIADNLSPLVERAFAAPAEFQGPELAMATVLFAFQIYCDFSAYSDIAVGTARLFGFELMRNFAYPYFSQSLGEFWRRWHISLMSWFKDYVYFPLGGSQAGRGRQAFNVMVTFLLSGLWHGASWNFILWGGLNGAALLPQMLRRGERLHATDVPGGEEPKLATIARILLTFLVVCVGWVFFRARTLSDAFLICRKIAGEIFDGEALTSALSLLVSGDLGSWMLVPLVILVGMEWRHRREPHPLTLDGVPRLARWTIYTALTWSIGLWGTFGGAQFIYFQF